MNLKYKIESILFAAGRSVKISELSKLLKQNDTEIKQALIELTQDIQDTGIQLLEERGKYQLVSAPTNAKLIADFLNAEIREQLTDAAIETLAIIAYKQPITRAEIETIRGVNSQYIIRQLSIRGLIERTASSEDARKNVYQTTLEFLKHMGITDRTQLPDFDEMSKAVSLHDEPQEEPDKAKPPEEVLDEGEEFENDDEDDE